MLLRKTLLMAILGLGPDECLARNEGENVLMLETGAVRRRYRKAREQEQNEGDRIISEQHSDLIIHKMRDLPNPPDINLFRIEEAFRELNHVFSLPPPASSTKQPTTLPATAEPPIARATEFPMQEPGTSHPTGFEIVTSHPTSPRPDTAPPSIEWLATASPSSHPPTSQVVTTPPTIVQPSHSDSPSSTLEPSEEPSSPPKPSEVPSPRPEPSEVPSTPPEPSEAPSTPQSVTPSSSKESEVPSTPQEPSKAPSTLQSAAPSSRPAFSDYPSSNPVTSKEPPGVSSQPSITNMTSFQPTPAPSMVLPTSVPSVPLSQLASAAQSLMPTDQPTLTANTSVPTVLPTALVATRTPSGAPVRSSEPSRTEGLESESPSQLELISAAPRFDISKCSTYGFEWLVDLQNTCTDISSLEGCECPRAEKLKEAGIITCAKPGDPSPPACPEACEVCKSCLVIIGCEDIYESAASRQYVPGP